MIRISLSHFAIALFLAPLGSLLAQPVVKDLMPLGTGQYVQYDEYDTASSGANGVKSHASYTILKSNETYQDSTGVSLMRDTTAASGQNATVSDLHYRFNDAGDMQVFADTGFLKSVLGTQLASGATPPNVWITEFKTGAGVNVVYPVTVINATYSGAQFKITFSGKYAGQDPVTVPLSTYNSAYRFDLIGFVVVSLGTFQIDTFSTYRSHWFVKNIGIIKTNWPITNTTIVGTPYVVGGMEKEMTAYGIAPSSGVSPVAAASMGIRFYPDPASDEVTVSLDHTANSIFLYNATGQMVRSFELSTHTGEAMLWVKDLPNGVYLARVHFIDGSSRSSEIAIQH